MKPASLKITALLLMLLVSALVEKSWGATSLNGAAEISYVKYNADVAGKEVFSGNTLAQKYSLSYSASNLYLRSQPKYYDLRLAYDWIDFNTKASDPDKDINIKQTFGKLRYSGEIGFNPINLPIKFRLYSNVDSPTTINSGFGLHGLMSDDLLTGVTGNGKIATSGAFFEFEPADAGKLVMLQGLPRLLLDYRETVVKNDDILSRADNKTKELAVAGLNKQNNWLNYRSLSYENRLNQADKYTRQQIQIGHVDNAGRRQWAALTNWIEVSADGQLTSTNSPDREKQLEEYDVNFMALAKRKLWTANTFMNYNRQLDYQALTESARIPIYVKGVYGSETDWFVSLNASRSRERKYSQSQFETSLANSITIGGTTFNRSNFNLSPKIHLQTVKSIDGIDSYVLDASLETVSSRRFSNKLALAGKVSWQTKDDGLNTANSKSWDSAVDFSATYKPAREFTYIVRERLETGSGLGYLDTSRFRQGANSSAAIGTFARNNMIVSADWMPSSQFTTGLVGSYDVIKAADVPMNQELGINYRLLYDGKETTFKFDSKLLRRSDGITRASINWRTVADLHYRPDRHNDGILRVTHDKERYLDTDTNSLEILQRYSYIFLTRDGVIRNLAALSEEFSYIRKENSGRASSDQYLAISGRYNPTEKLSLHGSVRYAADTLGAITMFYSAGVSADFKLLSASLDYAYAKRDQDNRIEKKLNAAVKRTF